MNSDAPVPFTESEIDRFVEQYELEEQRRLGYELTHLGEELRQVEAC